MNVRYFSIFALLTPVIAAHRTSLLGLIIFLSCSFFRWIGQAISTLKPPNTFSNEKKNYLAGSKFLNPYPLYYIRWIDRKFNEILIRLVVWENLGTQFCRWYFRLRSSRIIYYITIFHYGIALFCFPFSSLFKRQIFIYCLIYILSERAVAFINLLRLAMLIVEIELEFNLRTKFIEWEQYQFLKHDCVFFDNKVIKF